MLHCESTVYVVHRIGERLHDAEVLPVSFTTKEKAEAFVKEATKVVTLNGEREVKGIYKWSDRFHIVPVNVY